MPRRSDSAIPPALGDLVDVFPSARQLELGSLFVSGLGLTGVHCVWMTQPKNIGLRNAEGGHELSAEQLAERLAADDAES